MAIGKKNFIFFLILVTVKVKKMKNLNLYQQMDSLNYGIFVAWIATQS